MRTPEKPPPGYQRVYVSESGGAVDAHPQHGADEYADNFSIACILADRGEWVRLRPVENKPGLRNTDAFVGEVAWQFKTNRTSTTSAIDDEVRSAGKQASHVLLCIKSNLNESRLASAIQNRIVRTPTIRKMCIIHKGRLLELSRGELLAPMLKNRLKN